MSRYTEVAVADRAPAFADHLDLLIEAGDDPQATDPDPDRDAVRVLTVHRAKGLEFPVVFAVNLVAQKFPLQERRDAIRLPVEWMGGARRPGGDEGPGSGDAQPTEPRRNLHLEEERRLFYVAMTRARERLIFTSAEDHGSLRLRKPSQFIAEALDLPPAEARPSPVRQARERIARHAAQEVAATPGIRRGAETPAVPLEVSYTRLETYRCLPARATDSPTSSGCPPRRITARATGSRCTKRSRSTCAPASPAPIRASRPSSTPSAAPGGARAT